MRDELWEIQRIEIRTAEKSRERMREEVLRPLARLIARRLERNGLADRPKTGQTIAAERREVAA